jgi:hypothetical protein
MRTNAYQEQPSQAIFLPALELHLRVEDITGYPIILSNKSSHIGIVLKKDIGNMKQTTEEMHRIAKILTCQPDLAQTEAI